MRLASDLYSPSSATAATPLIKIFDVSDRQTLVSDRVMLKGEAPGAKKVIVNGQEVDVDASGKFRIGLVLQKGKNLIVVSEAGGDQRRTIRVIRVAQFSDLEKISNGRPYWARKEIINLATLGVVEGYPDGSFAPRKDITRGEFATWLIRARGDEVKTPAEDPFFDVPKEHWRAPYIAEAVKRGYMKGYSKKKFGIDDPITRKAAVMILDKAEGLARGLAAKKVFRDVSVNDPAFSPIWRAYNSGLIVGVSRNGKLFAPSRPLMRGEAVKIFSRTYGVGNRVSSLFDFGIGFDDSKLCKVNTEPSVIWARATPKDVPRDGQTPVLLQAKVEDKQGLSDISQVTVDLRKIGGPPDAVMYDDASRGDEEARDGIYSLQIAIDENAELGQRKLEVTAMDRSGWFGNKAPIEITVIKPW